MKFKKVSEYRREFVEAYNVQKKLSRITRYLEVAVFLRFSSGSQFLLEDFFWTRNASRLNQLPADYAKKIGSS